MKDHLVAQSTRCIHAAPPLEHRLQRLPSAAEAESAGAQAKLLPMAAPLNTVTGFTNRFADEIRVALNWNRFESERWPVERIAVHSPDQLAALEAPLCLDPDGHPCGLQDDGARRVTVGEVLGVVDRLGQRADFIREQGREYRAAGVMRDELPGYSLGVGAILMDGVHRSTAALMAEVPIELDLYVMRGPLDPDCLADLRI